jgi:hypothetical protein
MALLRLQSEWDCSAKPPEPTTQQIEALAKSFTIEPPSSVYAGLVRVETAGKEPRFELPLALAQKTAASWHEHELGLLLQGLKTLPEVRTALSSWLQFEGVNDPVHVVAPVLLWWLSPRCTVCKGIGERVVKGTNRTSGRMCGVCRGSGEKKLGHLGLGRKLLTYIRGCVGDARRGLKVKFKHQKADRRGRPDAPELLVGVGQRWRARNGKLWDVLAADNEPDSKTLLARLATNRSVEKLFRRNGRPFQALASGPVGDELVELVGDAPC